MTDSWQAQREALGAFIHSQRKLANLSLRQLADLTSLSTVPDQSSGGCISRPSGLSRRSRMR